MDAKEYKKRYSALNREYIKANNPYKYGEVVKKYDKEIVLLNPTGVNITSGCTIMYDCLYLDKHGQIIDKPEKIYGFEKLTPTGRIIELEEDLT